MTQPHDERIERKRYIRQRQRIVFTITGAALAVVFLVSSLFFFHVGGLGVVATAAVKPNYGVKVPCSVKDAEGKQQKYMGYTNIKVRVRNATKFSGLANAVAQALQKRQFSVVGYDTNQTELTRTTIYFGVNAINEAYTLNSNFTDAVMVMDDRSDKLVDVVLGATFNDLRDKDDVPSADETIQDFEGCVAADKMTNLPKAAGHAEFN
ncbi:LytR cell envelope-related transcriptional attenuator [Bifidobacterium goeldii]|uniref:LytR cell envelope-related transcriptional attenuator n=1 Tax=Bifidobacterium goeldii TaxID=2306975 RepID=A0A430FH94_9BIFI|nr:LytR C-terminal domain-containing protein [Bifidobacterium goeldii]RSX52161.1 LytR cell envelope-related transcriptional attenuator [Bifidobacterium goeldii]